MTLPKKVVQEFKYLLDLVDRVDVTAYFFGGTVKPAYSATIETPKIWQCNRADPIAGKYLQCGIRIC